MSSRALGGMRSTETRHVPKMSSMLYPSFLKERPSFLHWPFSISQDDCPVREPGQFDRVDTVVTTSTDHEQKRCAPGERSLRSLLHPCPPPPRPRASEA